MGIEKPNKKDFQADEAIVDSNLTFDEAQAVAVQHEVGTLQCTEIRWNEGDTFTVVAHEPDASAETTQE